jgi:molybdenum cofactor biosynthesis enzyme MoaA
MRKKLELQEIVWEITGECKNGCSYCGSKDAWNCITDVDKICKIADEIAKYPPKEINMSGGDPL